MEPAEKKVKSAKRERFGARLAPAQKELLQRAASLTGRSLTQFILGAAQEAAQEALRKHQLLELTTRETEAFLAALEQPPRLSPRLEEAIREGPGFVETRW